MRSTLRLALFGLALTVFSLGVVGHVRLIHPSTHNPLFWSSPTNVGIIINSAGSMSAGIRR